jgi:hypothetical protein
LLRTPSRREKFARAAAPAADDMGDFSQKDAGLPLTAFSAAGI